MLATANSAAKSIVSNCFMDGSLSKESGWAAECQPEAYNAPLHAGLTEADGRRGASAL